jgi:hypothetical protein
MFDSFGKPTASAGSLLIGEGESSNPMSDLRPTRSFTIPCRGFFFRLKTIASLTAPELSASAAIAVSSADGTGGEDLKQPPGQSG